jgi:hypothetical protein
MALSTHPGYKKPTGQLERLVGPLVEQSGDSDVISCDATSPSADFRKAKARGYTSKISLRTDGWWVLDQREADLAGPFKSLAELEGYLDWEDNQQIHQRI